MSIAVTFMSTARKMFTFFGGGGNAALTQKPSAVKVKPAAHAVQQPAHGKELFRTADNVVGRSAGGPHSAMFRRGE